MTSSFLQTESWAEFQRSVGHPTWRFNNGKIAANIIRHNVRFGFNYLYIPHGPILDVNAMQSGIRNEIKQFEWYLKNLAKEQKSMFVKIEPQNDAVTELLHTGGMKLKKSSKVIQANKTIILDLGRSEEELLAGMHPKTRYNIRVAEKHGVMVRPGSDIDMFWELLEKTTERQGFSAHTKQYYKKLFEFFCSDDESKNGIRAELLFAYYDGEPIAGALELTHGNTCYYLHGGSDYTYRQVMAPYALHWRAIKIMNERGCAHYDFGGSETVKWPGVTRFKLGFGGRQIEYPGSFDLVTRPFWYAVYRVVRKFL